MIGPRRLLPSMPALLALEAVDRLATVSAAAQELSLTQGAVSRALQGLEGQLGVALFVRERQRLRLTPAAQDYVRHVRVHLTGLSQASLRLRANPGGGGLSLAILPAFGVQWLAPRLPDFARANPGVTVHLSTRLRPFDFAAEGFDAAIHFGRADWPGAEHLLLLEEVVLPVCAPAVMPEPVTEAEALLALPLLQLESRPGAWGRYLAQQGLPGQRPVGMVFDQFATMIQAAIHGLGVALLPEFLIQDALRDGQLVPAWPARGHGLGSYYLVWPRDVPPRPPLIAFRDWIAAQAG
ncbi:MAG: LysR family transcriptional regulator [Pseudotabrizicola sp.]|uniref:LysR family transcriptional regulator n=1 Tax=Pseudotabrizicola sp. TaxID=2939647 RepID=UPI00272F48A9|nr:LysR family transcriptional regulator [Pseudotabrizicola sp.]MDP2081006.1 LysR family transcriptional regulator [Pseudotabrizicola sp.]MDZ7573638.1 LysR family transcriptional regulator [Pseudotabrizicola sp.]